jgi:hypothetical protein
MAYRLRVDVEHEVDVMHGNHPHLTAAVQRRFGPHSPVTKHVNRFGWCDIYPLNVLMGRPIDEPPPHRLTVAPTGPIAELPKSVRTVEARLRAHFQTDDLSIVRWWGRRSPHGLYHLIRIAVESNAKDVLRDVRTALFQPYPVVQRPLDVTFNGNGPLRHTTQFDWDVDDDDDDDDD